MTVALQPLPRPRPFPSRGEARHPPGQHAVPRPRRAAAVAPLRRLAAALPGTAVHYAVKANPHPPLLARPGRGRVPVRRGQPGRGARRARRPGATPERPRLLQPGQAARATSRSRPRLGVRLFVVDSLERGRTRSRRPRPARPCSCRIVTSGEGSDWPLSRKYGCSTDEAVRDPRPAAASRPRRRPASPSTSAPSSATRRPGRAPIAAAARVFAAPAAARAPPLAARPRRRLPRPPRGRLPAARRRTARPSSATLRPALRRPTARARSSSPAAASSATPARWSPTVVGGRRRGGTPLGVPRRRRLHRAGRDARRGDPLPAQHQRRRGATGPCVLAGPTCDSADVLYEKSPVHLPLALAEGDNVRLHSAGAYTTCYSRWASTASRRWRPGWWADRALSAPGRRTRRLLVGHALAAVAMSLPWPLLLVLVGPAGGGTDGDLLLGLAGAARMLPYVALLLGDRDGWPTASGATGSCGPRWSPGRCCWPRRGRGRRRTGCGRRAGGDAPRSPRHPGLPRTRRRDARARRRRARRRATDLLVTIEVASFVVGPALGGLLLASADPAGAAAGGRPARWSPWCCCTGCGCRPGAARPVGADRVRAACGARPRRAPGDRAPSRLLNGGAGRGGAGAAAAGAEDWSGRATGRRRPCWGSARSRRRCSGGWAARRARGPAPACCCWPRRSACVPLSPALGWAPAGAGGRGRRRGARRGRGDRDDPGRRTRRAPGRDPRADRQRDGRRRPAGLAARALAGHRARGPGSWAAGAARRGAARRAPYAGSRRRRGRPGRGSRSSGTARRGGRRGTLSRRRRSPAPARGRSRRPPRPRARWWSAAAPRG